MSLVLADRVRETTTSTGTGTINLEGAVQGFQRFSVLGNGNTTYYTIQGSIQWEVGIGTYNANTLTRDTVLDSSSAGALVNFSGGTKDVFVTLPAEKTITSITSVDGSVGVAQTGSIVDLSVAVAGATTNVICLVRNNSGATLTKGTAVYINGAIGQNPTVTKALATSDATSAQTLGLMTEDLANNSNGYVTIIGLITDMDTSMFSDGQQLYLSGTTPGGLTATKQYAPIHLVYVAVVEHAHPTQGKLFVKVQNGYEMDELHNVSAQSPNNGDILVYNSSTQLWETAAQASGGTVTSVSGTGTVSGLTLTGTVTTSGNLTLGGAITGFATSGANTNLTSVALTSGTITTAPSSSTDIVNKSYADSIASGVNFHAAVQYATTAALPANTYNNGSSGVGATLTANANGTLTIDGYTLVAGDYGKRLLIKNEVTQANNGVYTLTQAGTASLPYILTRATDYDSSGSGTNEVDQGDLILVINGTTNANTSWVEQTPLPITIGSTAIVFIQFAAVQTYTAGTGLTLTTNQFSITNTGTAGTYGSASQVPVITTNAQGQVTAVTNTAIAISGSAVTGNISGAAGSVANALTAGTNITFSSGTTYNGSAAITINSATVLAESTSVFTSGSAQTYTAPAGTQWVKVTAVGPGGNGGGATSQRATGGGGGGVAIKWLAMNAGQTLTYTVGTASGTASTVTSGTLTITTISAGSGTNGTGTAYALSQTAGGAGGTATGGDVNITGGQGGYSFGSSTTVSTNFSGKGGDCPGFGSGGPALAMVATAGVQGNGFGAGGGGAHGNATTAAGRGGVIIFEAF
jgi:hypothetical protein